MSVDDRGREKPTEASLEPRPPGPFTCRDAVEVLLDYLEATLGADLVEGLERHLADCAPCRAYLRTYRETRRLTGEVARAEMPDELKDRLRALLLDRLGPGRA